MKRRNALDTRYLRYQVLATQAGATYNPTGDTVQFQFTAQGTRPSSWITGSWETITATPTPQYIARILLGPANGGTVLAPGRYNVWIKVTDSPEVFCDVVGQLQID